MFKTLNKIHQAADVGVHRY